MSNSFFETDDIQIPDDTKEEICQSIASLVSYNLNCFIENAITESWATFDEQNPGNFKVYLDSDRKVCAKFALADLVDIAITCNNTKKHHLGLAEEFERLAKLLRDADHPH